MSGLNGLVSMVPDIGVSAWIFVGATFVLRQEAGGHIWTVHQIEEIGNAEICTGMLPLSMTSGLHLKSQSSSK